MHYIVASMVFPLEVFKIFFSQGRLMLRPLVISMEGRADGQTNRQTNPTLEMKFELCPIKYSFRT